MVKTLTRAQGATDQRAVRIAQADALIDRLESQIAHDANTRAALLGSIAGAGLIQPHRNHHAYALGADQADCELAMTDARAMRGLMSIGPVRLADRLDEAAAQSPAAHVTRLWRGILDADPVAFQQRGSAVDARRLATATSATLDQRTVFEAAVIRSNIVTPHRDQIAFALGADLYYCGLTADDAVAMLGLMSIGPARIAQALRTAAVRTGDIYVARLWPSLLTARQEEYQARGLLVRWQRRWARYHIEFDAWLASPRRKEDDWRAKPMTSGQRHLARDTAIILGCDLPEAMDCGTAHDWLMASGANALFRKEM